MIQEYLVSNKYNGLSIIVTADDVKYKIYGRPSTVRTQSKLVYYPIEGQTTEDYQTCCDLLKKITLEAYDDEDYSFTLYATDYRLVRSYILAFYEYVNGSSIDEINEPLNNYVNMSLVEAQD